MARSARRRSAEDRSLFSRGAHDETAAAQEQEMRHRGRDVEEGEDEQDAFIPAEGGRDEFAGVEAAAVAAGGARRRSGA
jgi:hypothetical protein